MVPPCIHLFGLIIPIDSEHIIASKPHAVKAWHFLFSWAGSIGVEIPCLFPEKNNDMILLSLDEIFLKNFPPMSCIVGEGG